MTRFISTAIVKYSVIFAIGLLGGLLMMWLVFLPESQSSQDSHSMHNSDKNDVGLENTLEEDQEPLYWVAPMDPNFIRDEPGQSPMGMDLLPVYGDNAENSPGTVAINSQVISNLGVRTQRAVKRELNQVITTVGYVTYDENQLVHMHPRVEGWVETLYVKASGDPVEKGEPVYSLYSPQLVAAQEELLIALSRNNKGLIQAAQDRLRALHLSEDIISDIKSSKKIKNTVTFYAPQSGVINNLNIREGFFVKPGLTLLSIANLDSVWVEAEIFERQAHGVQAGLPVTMTLDYQRENSWQGFVDYVYPILDEKIRTIKVRLKFTNPEHILKPNMFARVAIETNQTPETLAVPVEAVIRTGEQNRIVIANESGEFKSVAVELGIVYDHYAEIISGVFEGEKVVTSAQFLLDSESSKTSDFKRLDSDINRKPSVTKTKGKVLTLDPENQKVVIQHEAIKHWQWPAASVAFVIEPPLRVDDFTVGENLEFKFALSSGEYYMLSKLDTPTMQDDHSAHKNQGDQ